MFSVLEEAGDHVANYMIIEKRFFFQKGMQITFFDKVDVGVILKKR